MEILPWNSDAAEMHAQLPADCKRNGTPFGSMDMLIATRSASVGAVLVSNDSAFCTVKRFLALEDWMLAKPCVQPDAQPPHSERPLGTLRGYAAPAQVKCLFLRKMTGSNGSEADEEHSKKKQERTKPLKTASLSS